MRKVLTVVLLMVGGISSALHAEQQTAIFISTDGNLTSRTLSEAAATEIAMTLHAMERFRPFERNRYAADDKAEGDSLEQAERISRKMGASVMIVVSAYQSGNYSFGELRIQSLDENLFPPKRFQVRTTVMNNVPLLLAREVALELGKVQARAVAEQRQGELTRIDAGAWHGLQEGDVLEDEDGNRIEVVQTGQLFAWVKNARDESKIIIGESPNAVDLSEQLQERIEENVIRKHAELPDTDNRYSEKRLFESLLVINPGGNLVLPGYGAFLATHYMGFKNTEPSYPGVIATALLTVGHFAAVPVMTGFEGNFFPWKQDSDKSNSQLYLQKFLWFSVPFTFTAGYWDQLAVQYDRARVLPPLFDNRNSAAGFFSLLFPGGGLFYKGRRVEGWTYYSAEMALAGYASYNWESDRGKWALAGLGAVKFLECFHAWFARPGYDFYNREANPQETTRVQLGFDSRQEETEFTVGLTKTLHFR